MIKKMLERPNICYIFEKLRVHGCQIWHSHVSIPFNSAPAYSSNRTPIIGAVAFAQRLNDCTFLKQLLADTTATMHYGKVVPWVKNQSQISQLWKVISLFFHRKYKYKFLHRAFLTPQELGYIFFWKNCMQMGKKQKKSEGAVFYS